MLLNPLVSVIIPIFNASKFIEKCCCSLFSQTLQDLEFIFVNDGSTDNSIDIIYETIKRFPNRQDQVVVINRKENRGVSFTRQEGMERATGLFIIHCDSDDWVEPEMYKQMSETAINENADIVCCGYYVDNIKNERIATAYYPHLNYFSPLQFNIGPLTGSLVNKLIRREIIVENHISFALDINWGEDFLTSIKCLIMSKKTICMKECFYHYIQNESSITHNISSLKIQELTKTANNVELFLKKNNIYDKYKNQVNYLKFQTKSFYLMFPEIRNIEKWKGIYTECHHDIWKYESPLYLRFSSWLIIHNLCGLATITLKIRDIISHLKSR